MFNGRKCLESGAKPKVYSRQRSQTSSQMPTLIMESSPKFITCPDCGEKYDNARKRRLIDTCGHPRCYSCLFVDKPCPLCEKLPKERPKSVSESTSSSNENLEKVNQRVTNFKKDASYMGSQPDLNELHKARSSTLPPSFRQDSYFRSLYRYEPHDGSSDNLSTRSSSPTPGGRPRSLPPSYHVSIENLNEQFWKSVELAEKKIGPRKAGKEPQSKDPKEKVNSSTTEVVECPAPDVIRLPVRSVTHPKLQLEHHLRVNGRDGNGRPQEGERPRSFSDVNKYQYHPKNVISDFIDSRPLSWSPTQFPMANGQGSRPSSVATSSPTQSLSPHTPRSILKSDRFSDSSASIYLSDTWSESSDSDSVQSPTDETSNTEQRINDDSNPGQSPRKYTGNPLANVTYWVVEGRNSVEVHKNCRETEGDRVSPYRHKPPRVTYTNHWNGQTNRSPNVSIVSVHTDVSSL